jgi:hypothetical protein
VVWPDGAPDIEWLTVARFARGVNGWRRVGAGKK